MIYPKRTNITIFPISDVIIKFFRGEIINKMISITAMLKQMHTFLVVFEYSTTIIEIEDSINNRYIIYIDFFFFLCNYKTTCLKMRAKQENKNMYSVKKTFLQETDS
jgi:hypothetical protein